MKKNELFFDASTPAPSADETAAAPKEGLPAPLADGTVLRYVVEDSGVNYPDRGFYLVPGYDYEVGEDLDGQFAARLVQAGLCAVHEAAPEEAPAPAAGRPAVPPPAVPPLPTAGAPEPVAQQ